MDKPSLTGLERIPDGSWAIKTDEMTSCNSDSTPPVKSCRISTAPVSYLESGCTRAGIKTENPSELFNRQLSKTCGTNLIIDMVNLMADTKYSQSRKVKFPIPAKAPPPIAATHARAIKNLNIKEGVVG
jgi:hypothetical protein